MLKSADSLHTCLVLWYFLFAKHMTKMHLFFDNGQVVGFSTLSALNQAGQRRQEVGNMSRVNSLEGKAVSVSIDLTGGFLK